MRVVSRVSLVLLIAFLASAMWAQTTNARMTGTVSDPNGGVLTGVTVTATSTATGLTKTATTGDTGDYTIEALPPGPYRVEVKQTGFSTVIQNVTLETQQVAALNFTLQVGQTSQTITVTEDVPLVEANTSNISDVVVGRQIVDLPLNGRNFTQLATLVPGVTRGGSNNQASGSGNQAETFRYASSGGAALSVNGLRPQNNNYLLDGVDNNESLVNTIIFFPPAEAIQEFRVDTSVAPAEFGRAGGGVVNTAIRSGTNNWHGSAFFFTRNDNLDATPYFNATKPEFRRHQFGGSLGGAIIKNRLFIFGDFQGLRQFQPQSQDRATVPTDLMRNGDFSELLALPTPILINNPTTGSPFPGNMITPSLIIAPGQNYLNAYPEPNVTGTNPLCGQVNNNGVCIKQNYVVTRNTIQNFDDWDVRADLNLTNNDTIFGRYSRGKEEETTSSRLPALPAGFGSGTQLAKPRSIVIGETHTFSGAVVNEFRFGWVRTEIGYIPPFQDQSLSADLGIPNANTGGALGGGALIGGFNDQLEYTGDYGPYSVPEQTFQISDSMSFVKGHHAIKVGTTLMDRHVSYFRPLAGKGYFFLAGNGGTPSPTGYEVSDVLAGFVQRYDVGPALGFSHTKNYETGYYAQDDWKVNRRLTLNLGLRYDLYTWPSERDNLQANFDLATGHLVIPGSGASGGSALIPTDTNNFAPRLGFAYDLTGGGKTVLRGGFGIFYFLDRGGIDNQLGQNPPFSGTSSFQYTDGFRINLAGRAPDNSNDPTAATAAGMPGKGPIQLDLNDPQNVAVISYPTSDQNSYAEQWNLQVQRELGPNTAVSLGYVGTHGVHLMTQINYNRQFYDAVQGARAFPNLGTVQVMQTNGNSTYNSMQAEVRRRLVNGLQFLASYTWSHTIDDFSGILDPGNDRIDAFNFKHERGNSALDVRHHLIISSLIELPFGRGKKFGSDMPGVANALVGGWQLSPTIDLQSGQPFDLISSQQIIRTRPDLVGTPTIIGDINRWFDTSAFADPPTNADGVFLRPGTAPRNLLTGPSHKRADLSLFKNFKVGERFTTQFRAQFYNLTNTPQFSQPNNDVSSGAQNFGTIRGTLLSSERQIEMALRLSF